MFYAFSLFGLRFFFKETIIGKQFSPFSDFPENLLRLLSRKTTYYARKNYPYRCRLIPNAKRHFPSEAERSAPTRYCDGLTRALLVINT